MIAVPERVSIELTRRCQKACDFCYNQSGPQAQDAWAPEDVIGFVKSIAQHGTRAVSLGGGEPLQYPGLDEVFGALSGLVFLSMTTNGLLLDQQLERISRLNPNKVHISIHYPKRRGEVERVTRQVLLLRRMGIRAGVNLLVRHDEIPVVADVARQLRDAGITNESIVYLPMRGQAHTPTPADIAHVAGGPFQSMTCLGTCGKSPQFCSLNARQEAAHCSYTTERRKLASLDAAGLSHALKGLGLRYCGVDPS